ncbi:MAG: tRNA pseudouridine(38-40) synthase TruA [Gammaproteobacteria bacterium]|nr:tRNA pseudouridine(38-40) synthase TruA [Gammaproteobacteria bacterium]
MIIALGLEYDGGAFHGFQAQRSVPTVQENLEAALSEVAGESVRVTAAGRTDAGVHATQQVVSFPTRAERPLEAWRRGVNSLVDSAVSVIWSRRAANGFNARFDALERRYVYIFHESETVPALLRGKVAWSPQRLDETAMSRACRCLLGEQDFSSFRAAGCQSNTPYRCVHSASVYRRGHQVVLDIAANAFLLRMVRNIAGSLRRVGLGREDAGYLARLLACRDRTTAAPTAAAEGLYLVRVSYADFDVAYRPPPTLESA